MKRHRLERLEGKSYTDPDVRGFFVVLHPPDLRATIDAQSC